MAAASASLAGGGSFRVFWEGGVGAPPLSSSSPLALARFRDFSIMFCERALELCLTACESGEKSRAQVARGNCAHKIEPGATRRRKEVGAGALVSVEGQVGCYTSHQVTEAGGIRVLRRSPRAQVRRAPRASATVDFLVLDHTSLRGNAQHAWPAGQPSYIRKRPSNRASAKSVLVAAPAMNIILIMSSLSRLSAVYDFSLIYVLRHSPTSTVLSVVCLPHWPQFIALAIQTTRVLSSVTRGEDPVIISPTAVTANGSTRNPEKSGGLDCNALEATTSIEDITGNEHNQDILRSLQNDELSELWLYSSDLDMEYKEKDYELGSSRELDWLGHFAKKSTRLESIGIFGIGTFRNCSGHSVDRFLHDLSHLEELDIDGDDEEGVTNLNDDEMAVCIPSLAACTGMRSLTLN
ncbi:hypothetical protein THAOC_11421, partial [Thalassiosira oceanica]